MENIFQGFATGAVKGICTYSSVSLVRAKKYIMRLFNVIHKGVKVVLGL